MKLFYCNYLILFLKFGLITTIFFLFFPTSILFITSSRSHSSSSSSSSSSSITLVSAVTMRGSSNMNDNDNDNNDNNRPYDSRIISLIKSKKIAPYPRKGIDNVPSNQQNEMILPLINNNNNNNNNTNNNNIPIPSNDWWSSVHFPKFGNLFAAPLFCDPLYINIHERGFNMGGNNFKPYADISGETTIEYKVPGRMDLYISLFNDNDHDNDKNGKAKEFVLDSYGVSHFTGLWRKENEISLKTKLTLGKGLPMLYITDVLLLQQDQDQDQDQDQNIHQHFFNIRMENLPLTNMKIDGNFFFVTIGNDNEEHHYGFYVNDIDYIWHNNEKNLTLVPVEKKSSSSFSSFSSFSGMVDITIGLLLENNHDSQILFKDCMIMKDGKNKNGKNYSKVLSTTGFNHMDMKDDPFHKEVFFQWVFDDDNDENSEQNSKSIEDDKNENNNKNENNKMMIALYPHIAPLVIDDDNKMNNNNTMNHLYYSSPRGKMELKIITNDENKLSLKLPIRGILPSLPMITGILQENEINHIKELLINDPFIKNNNSPLQQLTQARDTYWCGKLLLKTMQLVQIADLVQEEDLKGELLHAVRETLNDWYTYNPDVDQDRHFAYNAEWTTLQGYPDSYGSAQDINDHHFHYGYFIHASALLGLYDRPWMLENHDMVDIIIADVANIYDANNNSNNNNNNQQQQQQQDFPFLRNFSPMEGHSWASGHGCFGSGNNHESSSESMNFATGMILWSSLTGNDEQMKWGQILYSMEAEAIRHYYFNQRNNVVYDDQLFSREIMGMLWNDGAAYATWFSGNPEMITGIQFLPFHGGSFYLSEMARDPYALFQQMKEIKKGQDITDWKGLMYMYKGLVQYNNNDIFNEYIQDSDIQYEEGQSEAYTYFWMLTLNKIGKPISTIKGDQPLSMVFENTITTNDNDNSNTTKKLLYCVYNPNETDEIIVTFEDGTSFIGEPNQYTCQYNDNNNNDNNKLGIELKQQDEDMTTTTTSIL